MTYHPGQGSSGPVSHNGDWRATRWPWLFLFVVCPSPIQESAKIRRHVRSADFCLTPQAILLMLPLLSHWPALSLSTSAPHRPRLAIYKLLSPICPFPFFFFFFSSYLPCLGGCAQVGGLPRIGPCIAQRGGTIRSTAFGSLTGVFFGTVPLAGLFISFSSFLRLARGYGEEEFSSG